MSTLLKEHAIGIIVGTIVLGLVVAGLYFSALYSEYTRGAGEDAESLRLREYRQWVSLRLETDAMDGEEIEKLVARRLGVGGGVNVYVTARYITAEGSDITAYCGEYDVYRPERMTGHFLIPNAKHISSRNVLVSSSVSSAFDAEWLHLCKEASQPANWLAESLVIDQAKQHVRADMRDPSSVLFRNTSVNQNTAGVYTACGEYNAKNAYGAYIGYSAFLFRIGDAEYEDDSGFFYRWVRYCDLDR